VNIDWIGALKCFSYDFILAERMIPGVLIFSNHGNGFSETNRNLVANRKSFGNFVDMDLIGLLAR
jgi:hypothetical protein